MADIIISRHAGAVAWLREKRRLKEAKVVEHFSAEDAQRLEKGDRIVGNLPLLLIEAVMEKGVIFDLLVLPNIAFSQRGTELTAEEMESAGAKLLRVKRLELEEVVA